MVFNWHKIWQKKGLEDTNNMRVLDGWESTEMDPEEVANRVRGVLAIEDTDTVLEVGCGAGLLSRFFGEGYVGVDYSRNMVSKNIEITNSSIICCEASDLIFKDNSFDAVFVYSVFHYFPSLEYAHQAISEMERVSKGRVYVGDLPVKSHDENHLLFSHKDFAEWRIVEGTYSSDRFDAVKISTHKKGG